MRVGHAGLALIAKRVRPAVPLWLLVAASYGPDVIKLGLALNGSHNPEWSHSLPSVGIGATVMAGAYLAWGRDPRDALAVWLTYASHWPADFITGHKPTWPGGPTLGLDLYDRPILVNVLEAVVLLVCWLIYRSRSSIVPLGRPIS